MVFSFESREIMVTLLGGWTDGPRLRDVFGLRDEFGLRDVFEQVSDSVT